MTRLVILLLLLLVSGCRASWPSDKCVLDGQPKAWTCRCQQLVLDRQRLQPIGHRTSITCDDVALPMVIEESR